MGNTHAFSSVSNARKNNGRFDDCSSCVRYCGGFSTKGEVMKIRFESARHDKSLRESDGLCTSCNRDARENLARIRAILDAYESGAPMQRASRMDDAWTVCDNIPMNFEDYRYRIISYSNPSLWGNVP